MRRNPNHRASWKRRVLSSAAGTQRRSDKKPTSLDNLPRID